MNFGQFSKRILLFTLMNILVVTTITIILSILRVGNYLPSGGLINLAVFCLIWGFVGAFVSLLLSRIMAKWSMGVQVISPDTNDASLRRLVELVYQLAKEARLPKMPQVGIYESPDVNAFATGPTKSRSLVAVSTGLLNKMNSEEVSGVIAHETAHIANGDMVTMTLLQGVINALVMFIARVLAFVVSSAMRSRNNRDSGVSYLLVMVFQVAFSLLGMIVLARFSRWREFRADAGGAQIIGRSKMVGALRALLRVYDPVTAAAAAAHESKSFAAFKISGPSSRFAALFSTHPPLPERIARLEQR
jgi:heat shock protein HtpX